MDRIKENEMPKVEINACTECKHFLFSMNGCVCTKLVEKETDFNKQVDDCINVMVAAGTWRQYNYDFHSGKLFGFVPDWCPLL